MTDILTVSDGALRRGWPPACVLAREADRRSSWASFLKYRPPESRHRRNWSLAVEASKPLILGAGSSSIGPHSPRGGPHHRRSATTFKSMDRGTPAPVMEAPASTQGRFGYNSDVREFTFSTRQRSISETLDRIERQIDLTERTHHRDARCCRLPRTMPDFVRQDPMPLLAAGRAANVAGRACPDANSSRSATTTLACVIAGLRRFVLFPPEQVVNLYIGPIDNPAAAFNRVDLEAPDFSRFPRFAKAFGRSRRPPELGPWRRAVHAAALRERTQRDIARSLQCHGQLIGGAPRLKGSQNPYDCFLTALLAMKDLPRRNGFTGRPCSTPTYSKPTAQRPALLIGMNLLRQFGRVSIDYGLQELRFDLTAFHSLPKPLISMVV